MNDQDFARFRDYLRFLARVQLDSAIQAKVDPSDIVQQSLLQAHRARHKSRAKTDPEKMAWLRQILTRNLLHAVRDFHRDKRDVRQEQSLPQSLEQSSARMELWAVASGDSPSGHAMRHERALVLARAVESLSADQREVILLRYWHGKKLREVADETGRTLGSVAGLLQRATDALREELVDSGVDAL